MRRGGGSRRGSFGGGSRSSGGGSRGGGFGRSRSYSSSSRMHRSSRRHHRHHHHYYGNSYYGRGYYGNRSRSHRGGSGSINGLLVFIFIITLILALFIAGAVSSPDNYELTLSGQTTYYINHSGINAGSVSIDVTGGLIETYVFDSEPGIASTKTVTESYSSSLGFDMYEYYGLSLIQGSDVEVSWSSSSALTYYVIQGDDNLGDWENGQDSHFYSNYGQEGSHTLIVDESATYYFAVESFTGTDQYTIDFRINIPVHDLADHNQVFLGSQSLEPSEIEGDALIIYNPSPTDDAQVKIRVNSSYGFFPVFLLVMAIGIAIIVMLRSRDKAKREAEKSRKSTNPNETPSHQEITAAASKKQENQGEKPAKSMEKKYVARPKATFCTNCGSGTLPDSKFCMECGHSL